MNQNRFYSLVREYAQQARRTRRSFAPMVHTLAGLRARELKRQWEGDPEYLARKLSDMQEFLAREYQIEDGNFQLRSYD